MSHLALSNHSQAATALSRIGELESIGLNKLSELLKDGAKTPSRQTFASAPHAQDTCPAVKSAAALALAETEPQSLNSLYYERYCMHWFIAVPVLATSRKSGWVTMGRSIATRPLSVGGSVSRISLSC